MGLETASQLKENLKRALRNVKAAYRRADTSGEKLEREINRILSNKKLYSASTIERLMVMQNEYRRLVEASSSAMNDFASTFMSIVR